MVVTTGPQSSLHPHRNKIMIRVLGNWFALRARKSMRKLARKRGGVSVLDPVPLDFQLPAGFPLTLVAGSQQEVASPNDYGIWLTMATGTAGLLLLSNTVTFYGPIT